VAAAAASAVLEVIESDNLLANTAAVGEYLQGRLRELQQKHAVIGEVRGRGLLQALELVQDRATREPAPAAAAAVLEAARENALLIGKGGLYGNVIRISPPMNIARADVDEFIDRLDASFSRSTAVAGG
jgi:4-aminobutyrate aminotransferase-like enzyme